MATILLTGVTGTVGSALTPLLKLKGHRLIYLIRPRDGQNSLSRLSQTLGRTAGGDIVWDGDITLSHLGVESSERRIWKNKIDKIVNCAASIKFEESLRELTTKVNIGGTRNILELSRELRIPEVHQLSTAYIAGDADYFREDDFDIGQNCRNVYEETKKEAEQLMRNWRYGRYSIYRLAIVVGDSVTGYTPAFNGYYGYGSNLWHLKQELALKSKSEMKKYEADGIRFDSEGNLSLPICMNFSSTSSLNIVPLDWATRVISDLVELPAIGQVFHIVHPQPPNVRWLNDVSFENLGIEGFYYGDSHRCKPRSLLGKIQRIFDRNAVQYTPYTTHEAKFEVAKASRILGRRYVSPPDIDEMFIAKLLEYAKLVDFGRKEQPKAVEV